MGVSHVLLKNWELLLQAGGRLQAGPMGPGNTRDRLCTHSCLCRVTALTKPLTTLTDRPFNEHPFTCPPPVGTEMPGACVWGLVWDFQYRCRTCQLRVKIKKDTMRKVTHDLLTTGTLQNK